MSDLAQLSTSHLFLAHISPGPGRCEQEVTRVHARASEGLGSGGQKERVSSLPLPVSPLHRGAHSAGRHHVRGKMLYSLGKSRSMRFRLRASRSLRHSSIMPGKWLIF